MACHWLLLLSFAQLVGRADGRLGSGTDFDGSEPDTLQQFLTGNSPVLPLVPPADVEQAAEQLRVDFQSHPLDGSGRLSGALVAELVRGHLERGVGWRMAGLERRGFLRETQGLHELGLFENSPPALISALRGMHEEIDGERLDVAQVAVLVAAIRRLQHDSFIDDAQEAFEASGLDVSAKIDNAAVLRLLTDWFTSTFQQSQPNRDDSPFAVHVVGYFHSRRLSAALPRNPFLPLMYTFDEVVEIIAMGFGQFSTFLQDGCVEMQDGFAEMSINGTFSILAKTGVAGFGIAEDVDYLEAVGAMPHGSARLWLPNYVASPSNCAGQAGRVTTCCASLCDPIVAELRAAVGTFQARAEELIGVAAQISSRYVDTPRTLSAELVARLHKVASDHGGTVQLHSRSFDGWLHAAFPNECPFPSETKMSHWVDHHEWMEKIRDQDMDENAEKRNQRHLDAGNDRHVHSEMVRRIEDGKDIFYGGVHNSSQSQNFRARHHVTLAVMLASLLSAARAAWGAARILVTSPSICRASGKGNAPSGCVLPF